MARFIYGISFELITDVPITDKADLKQCIKDLFEDEDDKVQKIKVVKVNGDKKK